MPRISEFQGILIEMYHRDHTPPHFHAIYGEHEALIGIDPIRIIEGRLPSRARNLVLGWTAIHQDELAINWSRARNNDTLLAIRPLS